MRHRQQTSGLAEKTLAEIKPSASIAPSALEETVEPARDWTKMTGGRAECPPKVGRLSAQSPER